MWCETLRSCRNDIAECRMWPPCRAILAQGGNFDLCHRGDTHESGGGKLWCGVCGASGHSVGTAYRGSYHLARGSLLWSDLCHQLLSEQSKRDRARGSATESGRLDEVDIKGIEICGKEESGVFGLQLLQDCGFEEYATGGTQPSPQGTSSKEGVYAIDTDSFGTRRTHPCC